MKRRFSLVMVILLSLLCIKCIYPQEPPPEKQVIESLEFREVDIKDVLRQIAKQYDLNIVFSESIKGVVTVQLSNVTVEQALDAIITVNGFAYTKKENVYKVTTPEEAEREGKMTKLFRLNNADAGKLKDSLKKVLTADGSIEADARSNSLIVTDTPGVINKIEAMISDLDSLTPQVLIEAKLIETSLTNTEKLGIDWQTTITAKGAKRLTTAPFRNWGSDKDMYPTPEYSETWTWVEDPTQWVTNPNQDPTDPTDDYIHPYVKKTTITSDFAYEMSRFGSFPMAAASYFSFGTLDFTALQAVFDFLKSRTDTKLIANPRIVTLNNQKATINVGEKVPLPIYTIDEATGRITVSNWEYMDVGVNLAVTPQVSPDGHIRLKLKPEVSSLTGQWIGPVDNQRPITSSRVAETEVQIKDGQTVVIGGLVKEKTAKTIKKIPILGDIPFVGLLFTRKVAGTEVAPQEKTDLLIFVTATIIKGTEPLLALESSLITSPPKPFKLEAREVK